MGASNGSAGRPVVLGLILALLWVTVVAGPVVAQDRSGGFVPIAQDGETDSQPASSLENSDDSQPASSLENSDDSQPASSLENSDDSQPASSLENSDDSQPASSLENSDDSQPASSLENSDEEVRVVLGLLIAVAAVALLGTLIYWVRTGDGYRGRGRDLSNISESGSTLE